MPADASDLSDADEYIENNHCTQNQKHTTFGNDIADNDAVYINTRTSTNDSGLGGSSRAPQDYANTNFRMLLIFYFFILLQKFYF